jgi:uncharacterized protein (TIGR02246 family)
MASRTILALLGIMVLSGFASASQAATAAPEELGALRDEVVGALNAGDVEALVARLTPDVVVTLQNAEVARGRDGVRAYYRKMTKGSEALVASYQTTFDLEGTTLLGGDTAVAFGTSNDRFTLSSGVGLDVASRWTATLVRQDGRWYVASFHTSTNMFDNAILQKMKVTAYIAGVFGLVLGLILGVGAMVAFGQRKKAV